MLFRRHLRRAWRLLAGLLLFHAAPSHGRPRLPGADGPTVAYGADPAQFVMLFPAPGPGPHPLVLFVHGGGWTQGHPRAARGLAPALNAAGFTLISAGYRLVPQTDVAGAVTDVAHAVAFVLQNAGKFAVDPNAFALAGHSSGGHAVALLATDPRYLRAAGVDPAKLKAVLLLDGVFDVAAMVTNYPNERRISVFGQNPSAWQQVSPDAYVASMTTRPRFCLAHENTASRFVEQADIFTRTLRAHGQTVDELVVPGLKHGDMLWQASDPGEPIAAFATRCLGAALPAR